MTVEEALTAILYELQKLNSRILDMHETSKDEKSKGENPTDKLLKSGRPGASI